MPCTKELKIDTSEPVLVTGATGYLAGVLISQLLEKGVTVHATVRDPSKEDQLEYLNKLTTTTGKGTLKFFKADLLVERSFDEAAKGCRIIFHMASPFGYGFKDPMADLIEPAVRGTENVLNTATATPSVKRVVLTSSCLAIYGFASDVQYTANGVFTEEEWNRSSTLECDPYGLSKTKAEQKAWVMAGSQTQWDMVVLNPGLVMGPGIKYHESAESYKLMLVFFGGANPSGTANFPAPIVDVRDVAAAHMAGAYLSEAKGRYIVNGSNTTFPQMGKALTKKYDPSVYPISGETLSIPKYLLWLLAPYVGLTRKTVAESMGYSLNLDNTKAMTQLGMEFLPLETTMQDMYEQLLDLKVVGPKA